MSSQLVVNARFLSQRVTGMQRYAREILARLPSGSRLVEPGRPTNGMRGHLWEQSILPWKVGKGLLWSPCTTGPLAIRHQVVTIHDCAFVDQATCFSRSFAAWLNMLVPQLSRRVEKILTVSDYSRQRISEVCKVPLEKVVTVHNGVDSKFTPATEYAISVARKALDLPEKYVLCVGSLEPRKNLRRLLAAWQSLAGRTQDHSLVIAGGASHVFRDAGFDALPENVKLAGYVSDEHLAAVYSGATAFVYPSLYEGFGLTVLEAMACGVPVVTSNTTSLPEVAGDAAILISPEETEAIAAGLLQLLEDSALRDRLIAKGLERVKQFTWDAAAQKTWQALSEVM
ncbi:MAG: glycosyltransferase family 1 protein [Pirellulales bacterium]